MRTHWKTIYAARLLSVLASLLTATLEAQFDYTTNNGTITITRYRGPGGTVIVPERIEGLTVTGIAESAFYGYYSPALTNVTIPATVTSVSDTAFRQCTELVEITVDPTNPAYTSLGGVLFDQGETTLVRYPQGKSGDYTIPDGVIKIGNSAFELCVSLTNIAMPESLTDIGDFAFWLCYRLRGITIPGNVTNIGAHAFRECYGLTDVTIPDSVRSIGEVAFGVCTYLRKVIMGENVASIGSRAFVNCSRLGAVYFRGNAPTFGDYVFAHTTYPGPDDVYATIYYLPGTSGWGSTSAVLWNPQFQTSSPSFGVGTNGFGFTITGAEKLVVVVEACTNLVNPIWFDVATLTGGAAYFSDPEWTNSPSRFYRLRAP